ncbi:MAG: AraC-like DNA-binding protein [Oceanicoccus sp.]|jgi:AraC-like DNA-binding protein
MMYRECHEPIYPAHYQLLRLMDLLDAQGLHHHQYLKGTGLFYDDIASGNKLISAVQFIQLIENAQKLGEPSLAFRWGHSMWPGHYDVYSQLLQSTQTLAELLQVISRYSEMLCPLLKPVVISVHEYTFVYWQDEMGVNRIQRFLVEAYTTAVMSLSHWFSQQKLPWKIGFSFSEPKYNEEYVVNLGEYIQFEMGIDVLVLNNDDLNQPWPNMNMSHGVNDLLKRQADLKYDVVSCGLVGELTRWNQAHIQANPTLEHAAIALNISCATLKRKLKAHGTSFQKIQDQARLATCLYLLHHKKWSNQKVADYLQFSDAHNFRKAFKRWCGSTPNGMREKLEFHIRAIS